MLKVSAVIVTYNRLNLLKKGLKCLLNQKYKLNNIIVINNNSSDGTKEYLNHINDKNIYVVNMNKNLGGAGGFSLGTNIAYEKTDSQYFWLMDDDTLPTPSALDMLMNKAKELDYNFGFLCSNVRWWKNKRTALTNMPIPAKDWTEPLLSNLIKVSSASFVSVLFSRNSVKKLGLPIANMFIWGDDVDFTRRLSRDNSRNYLVTNSIVMHHSNENCFYNIINSPRVNFYKFGIRNTIYNSRKFEKKQRLIKRILKYCFIFLRIPFNSKNKRLKRMILLVVGLFNGFFFNPKIHFPNEKYMRKYIENEHF